MNTVSIREARTTDADALARLCAQLGYPAEPSAMPARVVRLAADGNTRALVAVYEDMVVGLATVQSRHTLNHEAPIAQLTLLVVDEANRKGGVGRALVSAAERWAIGRGCKRIVVTTALPRLDAHAFYERIDFRHTGRRYGKDLPTQPAATT
ncbi:MAG: GNAT family N-acetyltransferase [bacterium]